MTFEEYQSTCKYREYALKRDTVGELELTCRNPDNIPPGCSWVKCCKSNCPQFRYTNVKFVMIGRMDNG